MPKWAKYALIGAITAVVTDYFLSPALKRNMGV